MTWHYQITRDNDGYALREVYHMPEGVLWTEEPVGFFADPEEGPETIVKALEMALADAKTRGVRNINEGGDGANAAANPRGA